MKNSLVSLGVFVYFVFSFFAVLLIGNSNLESLGIFFLIALFIIFSALLGLYFMNKKKNSNSLKLKSWFLIVPFFIILITRLMPYINNDIPLGYDPGMYMSLFETNSQMIQEGKINDVDWAYLMHPIAISYIANILINLGISVESIVMFGVIILDLLIMLGLYMVLKIYFDKTTAIIGTFIYSISLVAYDVFYMNYIKNMLGIFLILVTIYLFKKKEYILAVLTGGFIGGVHRPSFAIFGSSYLMEWFLNRKKVLFFSGVFMILLTSIFYIDRLHLVLPIFEAVSDSIVSETNSGSFISISDFILKSIIILIFFFTGFFSYVKNKKFDTLFFWFIISLIIVIFQLFFHDRMLIFMNIIVIIFSAYGFKIVYDNLNWNVVMTYFFFLIGFMLILITAINTQPLITENEFETINWLNNNLNDNDTIVSTDKFYSVWFEYYSNKTVIGGGRFDNNYWDEEEFLRIINENVSMLNKFNENKMFIFIGRVTEFNNSYMKNNKCFNTVYKNNDSAVIEMVC